MRTQERFSDKKLVGPYRGEVEQDLADAPRFIDGIAKLFAASDIKGYEAPLATLSAQLKAYEDWTRAQILPRARSDHRLPPATYADNLKTIGRASCRERVCLSVWLSVVVVTLKKKPDYIHT